MILFHLNKTQGILVIKKNYSLKFSKTIYEKKNILKLLIILQEKIRQAERSHVELLKINEVIFALFII